MTHAEFRRMVEEALRSRVHGLWWHDPMTIALRPLKASTRIVPLLLVRRTGIHRGASPRARPFFLKLDCRWSHRARQTRTPYRRWGRDCQAVWSWPWGTIAEQAKREACVLTGVRPCAEPVPNARGQDSSAALLRSLPQGRAGQHGRESNRCVKARA